MKNLIELSNGEFYVLEGVQAFHPCGGEAGIRGEWVLKYFNGVLTIIQSKEDVERIKVALRNRLTSF